MAYLGNPPAEAYTNTVKDSFSGDGSTVAFTMSLPTTTNNVRVVVENVIQDPTVAYSCSGTTLTFTSAPPSGTNNIYVVHLGPAVMTTVPPTEITEATTYTSDLTVQGAFTVDKSQDAETNIALTNTNTGSSAQVRTKYTTDGGLFTVGKTSDAHVYGGDAYVYNVDNTNIRFATNDTERMRIENGGAVRIGGQTGTLKLGNDGTYYADIEWEYANNELAFTANNVANFTFNSNGSERVRIQSGGGISFNGDTAAANALDDYEEGTWTPVLSFSGGNGTGSWTYNIQEGNYTKIGRMVYIRAELRLASFSKGTASGAPQIGTLPFTGGGITYGEHNGLVLATYNAPLPTTSGSFPRPLVGTTGNTILLYQINNNGAYTNMPDPTSTSQYKVGGWYSVA